MLVAGRHTYSFHTITHSNTSALCQPNLNNNSINELYQDEFRGFLLTNNYAL